MLNAQVLDIYINKSGLKTNFIIDKLGISNSSFYKKKSGSTPFRAAEIYVLTDLLRLSDDEVKAIFFA